MGTTSWAIDFRMSDESAVHGRWDPVRLSHSSDRIMSWMTIPQFRFGKLKAQTVMRS
ncbi:MAG: hypothetical protein KAZ88_11755 [Acidimicrobiia bacterium]|nr:hypothetical protein [Acidimicrobiia bacterium]